MQFGQVLKTFPSLSVSCQPFVELSVTLWNSLNANDGQTSFGGENFPWGNGLTVFPGDGYIGGYQLPALQLESGRSEGGRDLKGIHMRSILLIFGTTLLAALFIGCTQKDDIVTPVSQSVLALNPQNLPTPPSGMVYELWISKETVRGTDFDLAQAVSLGRFSYVSNDSVRTFLDAAGSPRDSVFKLSGDFQSFRSVFVGLHRTADAAGTAPGAIMLIAYIPSSTDIPIRMVFPQADSLWQATCRYNLEGVSDNNRGTNDAHGVWFSSYRTVSFQFPDTTAIVIDSSALDTIKPIICTGSTDTCNIDSLKAEYPYSVSNYHVETKRVIFPNDSLILGIDSFMHTGVRFTLIRKADSSYPYTRRKLTYSSVAITPRTLALDIFSQDEFGLPIVSEWGWKYAGWALTPHILPSAQVGAFTPPAWPYETYNGTWIGGGNGGMIPTGTFANINAPDDANPFSLNDYLPPFPGEDFLNAGSLTDSLGVTDVNLMPTSNGNVGSILVSLEPDNRLTTKTNFPLIAFVGKLPVRTDSIGFASVAFNMINGTSTLLGNQAYSFPIITVDVKRY